jgi:hypothetical protein
MVQAAIPRAAPPKPIAIGICKEIIAAAIESRRWSSKSKARDAVGAALCYRTGSIAYLTALAEPGAMRHGLDGGPAGAVDAEHQAEAAKLIEAPTQIMNPSLDPAIIAEAYESDPEAARAEYGAEFRDDLADYITREAVDAVTMWGRSRPACNCIPGGRPFPTALDPFTCNRYECAEFAKECVDLDVRYIGLCCGAAPHHIRAVAEAIGRVTPTPVLASRT